MEKKQKILQIYAVIICIVTVITFLISVSSIVSAYLDRSDPLHAWKTEISLSSFENFKMDVLKTTQKDQAYIPDDPTIQKMYDDAKSNKIKNVLHRSNNTIVVSAIIIVISIILFFIHWMLIRRLGKTSDSS
jgi:ATP-dependent Zn protease